ncbi:ABC transporter permease [Streptomyces sp. E2N166]|uniref:ABC transporter permease n=1 Tax=Streptomyces sp. E2N166 TaxID=1851909 RepID=UPI00237BD006|nr:ABC transporter permease [Streptomyces sp. E2N166]
MANFASAEPSSFLGEVKSGFSANEYAQKVAAVVQPLGGDATTNAPSGQEGVILIMSAMAALLTLMLVSVAGLGVLSSVVMDTREHIHDLGVCKAIGMAPRQTMSLVLSSVAAIGVIGGLIGVPAGYALRSLVMPLMGRAVGTRLPSPVLDVYEPAQLLLLGLGGVVIAVLGALVPVGWAARARTGHGAAHRVASGGARAAGADPPGPCDRAARTGVGADAPVQAGPPERDSGGAHGTGSGKRWGHRRRDARLPRRPAPKGLQGRSFG